MRRVCEERSGGRIALRHLRCAAADTAAVAAAAGYRHGCRVAIAAQAPPGPGPGGFGPWPRMHGHDRCEQLRGVVCHCQRRCLTTLSLAPVPAAFYGAGTPRAQCLDTIKAALQHGCTFFDTAELYNVGKQGPDSNEGILGEALGWGCCPAWLCMGSSCKLLPTAPFSALPCRRSAQGRATGPCLHRHQVSEGLREGAPRHAVWGAWHGASRLLTGGTSNSQLCTLLLSRWGIYMDPDTGQFVTDGSRKHCRQGGRAPAACACVSLHGCCRCDLTCASHATAIAAAAASGAWRREAVERSLANLGVEFVDLFYLHRKVGHSQPVQSQSAWVARAFPCDSAAPLTVEPHGVLAPAGPQHPHRGEHAGHEGAPA